MFRKTVLALTAIAALGATAVTPTTADAGWKKWKHHHHHFHGHRGWGLFGPALVAGAVITSAAIAAESCYETQLVETRYGLRKVRVYVC
jgi:hypothetical protein